MILEVQIQNFSASAHSARWRIKKFSFSKIPGGLNINIFCENWYAASFYNKEQVHKLFLKFELKKLFCLTPEKVHFWVLKKTPQNNVFKCF